MEKNKLVITPKTLRGEDGHTTFSVRMTEELHEKIQEVSKQTGHSRNALISMFIEYALENSEIKQEAD